MFSTPFASQITGIGSAFPERVYTNAQLARDLAKNGVETTDEWIAERTGIKERRISDTKNESERNSSLGHQASLKAMEMAGVSASDIDLILYGTCSPDTLIPSTACWLQHKMGAKNAAAMDLNAACSGFVYGLTIADQFIKTGHSKCVLVVGAEVLNTYVNWMDRTSCILFGDGAGAAIVRPTKPDNPHRILSCHLGADGNLWDLLYIPTGGSNAEVTSTEIQNQTHKMRMKGKEIFKVATITLTDYAIKAMEQHGFQLKDIDWFIPHQANLRILEATAKRIGFPMDRVLMNLERYGNTSAATVPTVLDEAVREGKIKKGQLILLDVFGAGLTFGSVLIRW